MMREIVDAVKQAIPDAAHTRPGEVLERVLSALRQADAKLLEPALDGCSCDRHLGMT